MSDSSDGNSHSGERFTAVVARIVTYVAYVYLVLVEIILVLGFFLLLLGANPSSEFTRWAYRSLDRAMGPFRGIFEPIDLGSTGSVSAVFDTSIIFAMVAYGVLLSIVGSILHRLTRWINHIDVERRLDAQRAAYADAATTRSTAYPDVVGAANAQPLPAPSAADATGPQS